METQSVAAASSHLTHRRSRMHRQSVGKHIELTERDREVFALLARYRYLRSTYLHAFVGGASQTRFLERLGALYHDGRYVNRPTAQWDAADARCAPAVYELDRLGREALAGRMPDRALFWDKRDNAASHFHHSLMVCEVLASIELGIRQSPGVRFVSCGEILSRVPGATLNLSAFVANNHFTIVPDALFGIQYADTAYRFFALEVERRNRVDCANLTQTSWRKKVLCYRDIAARKTYAALGIPNLLVLAVAPSAAHIANMKKLVLEVTEGKGSPMFLFRSINHENKRPMVELLSEAWERSGREDFHISKA